MYSSQDMKSDVNLNVNVDADAGGTPIVPPHLRWGELKIRKDDLMDQNQILQDDRSIFWEDLYVFEIFKMAAISKWPPVKEGYPKIFKC